MYVPDHYRVDDIADMHGMMRANPFAVLVSHGADGLVATHLPTVLKADAGEIGVIEAHFARANPHWKMFDPSGTDALLIYSGPHIYIRPSWYPTKAENGKVVPTWNYAAVHVYGRVELVHEADWLHAHVSDITHQQEAANDEPWAVSDAPEEYTKVMLRGIVGMRFEITRVEGKRKMSQNKSDVERRGVVEGLRSQDDSNAAVVAQLVEGQLG